MMMPSAAERCERRRDDAMPPMSAPPRYAMPPRR